MEPFVPFDDIRELTRKSRAEIGFPSPGAWQDAPAYFDGHTLTIEGHPVMEDWEDEYMRQLAQIATTRGGTVLEIGFGLGLSARHIQSYPIEEHLIIEANRQVFAHACEFRKRATVRTRTVLGRWETVTPLLPAASISGILFDTYPLSADEIHRNHFRFFPEAYRLLMPGGVLTYYSDEVEEYSPEHMQALQSAGFTRIDKRTCTVAPPPDCLYWRSTTILAPIIIK